MWPSGQKIETPKLFLKFKAKQVLMNSYILPDFDYCPLASMFCLIKCANIIESLQKKALILYHTIQQIQQIVTT